MKPVWQELTRLRVTFDDDKAVANAGLVMTSMLAQRLSLVDLFNATVTVGDTYGRHPDAGTKAMTVISSLLSGGEFIADIAALHTGATGRVTGHGVISASRVGQWLRAMTLGQITQFEQVAGVALSRAWSVGAGPRSLKGRQRLVLDIDGTITETYGHAKAGATRRTYLGTRGYHPLVCAEAETGQVVHSRLRAGTATASRGAGHFVSQAFRKVRAAAADPAYPLLLRADSGFYSYPVISACVRNRVQYSVTARQFPPIRQAIDQIPPDAWEPATTTRTKHVDVAAVDYLIKGKTDAANTPIPCRLIVRRTTAPADTGKPQPRLFDV
ncbi:MAG: IS1380 family transposase, partial [Planctomycetota bacterium]